ncbi:uncharacterized protein LOC124120012 [Haliotis rufescens]|uniref:uncharacterized protein LOC124120012 n=1 Tax=Haliotis rufescens TaxID=6454 RepID=UPI00201F94C1|nr:uncharacterized protein LOC124120012 [Haliotis rufescens]XP_046338701.2 uncharacterized protein LOC124120012 [Haliotis rufescens]XP_046338707.2 uncharacterized protein LOC124120012 [Haliotis rufescens]XP_046338712.2 uncharacterized protein LOC124120012 [Haliotis rufescens]
MSIRLSVHRPKLTMPALTEASQRPACMPGSKDECLLPRISQRGSCSDSDSVVECRRGAIARVPPSAASSVSSSPVKLPAISGKAKSNSVSSLSNGMSPTRREDQRSNLCRSPSCPSNLGFWYDRDGDTETPTPVDKACSYPVSQISKRDSGDLKLPNIKDRNSMCSGTSQITVRSLATQRSPTKFYRDISPHTRRDTSVSLPLNREITKDISTPRAENVLDSQRSNTQSALLLPIRNSESRLSLKGKKKKKKKQGSRQNTDVSINSENNVVDGTGGSENYEQMKTKMEAIDAHGYFSDAEGAGMSDERFITKVKEENHVSKGKDGIVKVNKRHKLKKRMTDNNLYFERELTQVNA